MGSILVTGAGGYLGGYVFQALRDAGHEAIGLSRRPSQGMETCDLLNKESLRYVIDKLQPSRVLHCAWETPKNLAAYHDNKAAQSGLEMLDNLLAATDVPIIYVSSMTVYGSNNDTTTRREQDAGHPESAYGRAKWEAEQLLSRSGRPSFAVRIPGLFGGFRHSGLIYNVLHALKKGTAPELPKQPLLWAAMDVRDAADSIGRLCILSCTDHVPINIGYPEVYSISRLMTLLGELTGRTSSSSVEHPDFAFDLSLARSLGVMPKQTLQDACQRLLNEMT